jgi:uncharacterized RDD family membrane protein YckC
MDTGGFIAPTFGQRLGGRLLDSLLFVPIALTLGALYGTAGRAVRVLLYLVYEVSCIATSGRTIGKIAAGTRVVDAETGGKVSAANAFVRYAVLFGAGAVLSFVGLGVVPGVWAIVIAIMVLRPPLHRGAHDLAARTIVVPTRVTAPGHNR